jgi:hypothetical protein
MARAEQRFRAKTLRRAGGLLVSVAVAGALVWFFAEQFIWPGNLTP